MDPYESMVNAKTSDFYILSIYLLYQLTMHISDSRKDLASSGSLVLHPNDILLKKLPHFINWLHWVISWEGGKTCWPFQPISKIFYHLGPIIASTSRTQWCFDWQQSDMLLLFSQPPQSLRKHRWCYKRLYYSHIVPLRLKKIKEPI